MGGGGKCKSLSQNDDISIDNIIISEAHQHRHTSPKDNIINVLAGHFSGEVINTAKTKLFSKYGDLVGP